MRLLKTASAVIAILAFAAEGAAQGTCMLTTKSGRDLNPLEMTLAKQETCESVHDLYSEISRLKGDEDFEFVVTGGDRFEDEVGHIRSSSNFEIIWNSSATSFHLDGAAVDIRIRGVSREVVLKAWEMTDFYSGYISDAYADGHWHFQFPRREFADRIVVATSVE